MSIVEKDGEVEIKIAGYTLTIADGFWVCENPDGIELSVPEEKIPDGERRYLKSFVTDYKLWNNAIRYPKDLEEYMETTIWPMLDVVEDAIMAEYGLEVTESSEVSKYDPSEDFVKVKTPQEIWRERRNQIAKGNKQIYDYLID